MKRRMARTITELAEEILSLLHEINQKVEHVIKRLPKNGHHHLHDSHLNDFFD